MKLIIDIPDEMYNCIKKDTESEMYIIDVIKKGIPYEEKPQGKWLIGERNGEGYDYYCSRCMQVTLEDINRINFCPKCGAKMQI